MLPLSILAVSDPSVCDWLPGIPTWTGVSNTKQRTSPRPYIANAYPVSTVGVKIWVRGNG